MSGYGSFARYYDLLTGNVDYRSMARRFGEMIGKYHGSGALVLDLACGTGNLTLELAALGYDMIGVDASEEMLAAAMGKISSGGNILYLCQRAEELNLYGTVDACVCALDSLNHLPGEAALKKAMERVALFLNPGGLFIFDMNTPYKHRHVLSDTAFVYECGEVFCAWRNEWDSKDDRVNITLDFFVPAKIGCRDYRRETEEFCEYAYPAQRVAEIAESAGLQILSMTDGDEGGEPVEKTQRILYLTQKIIG